MKGIGLKKTDARTKKHQKKSFKKLMLGAVVCAPLFTAACTTATEPIAQMPEPGKSAYANYLMGQFAVRHRQMKEAADFLSAVQVQTDIPGPLGESLERQLFTVLAGEGRIEEAAKVARDIKLSDLMARVVLVIEDVANDKMVSAQKRAVEMSSKGLGLYIKPLIHAWTIAANEDADAALASLEGFEKQGLEALYHMHSALLNQFAGRLDKAEEFYKKAAGGQSGMSLRLAELYGTMLVKQGRMEEAQKVYTDYFRAHPDSLYIQAMLEELNSGVLKDRPDITVKDGIAETLFGLASSLRSHSTRQAGLIMGQLALHVKPDFPIAQILVAEILETDKRFSDANAVYNSVPVTNPFSWSARLRMALNLDDMDEVDEAVRILNDMVKQHPDRLEALVTLGDVLRHRERFDEAQAAYGKALRLIGDNNIKRHHWNLIYSRAISLERLKRWDEAEALFLKALELEPKQPFVLNYLGYSWIEAGLHLEKAQKMIEEAVAQRPRDGYIVDSLGWVLYRLGDYEKAVPHLERAVELQPSDPVINDHLGDVYWKVGRTREARFQWKRAKSLNPEADVLSVIEEKLLNGLMEE